jgi:hypothetical protein
MRTFHNEKDIDSMTETRLQIAGALIAFMTTAVIIVATLFDVELNPVQALCALFGG